MKSPRHDREGAKLTEGRTARREVPGFRALVYSSHWQMKVNHGVLSTHSLLQIGKCPSPIWTSTLCTWFHEDNHSGISIHTLMSNYSLSDQLVLLSNSVFGLPAIFLLHATHKNHMPLSMLSRQVLIDYKPCPPMIISINQYSYHILEVFILPLFIYTGHYLEIGCIIYIQGHYLRIMLIIYISGSLFIYNDHYL